MAVDMIAQAMAMDAAQQGGMSPEDKAKLDGIAPGAEVNVQSDWNEAESTADDFIKNKPALGTAAAADMTTSITSGGTGLPTSGTVYTDQQRQDAEIGSLVDRGAKNLSSVDSIVYTGESAGWKAADLSPNIAFGTYKLSCDIERPSGSVAGVQIWCKYTDNTTEMIVANTQETSVVSTITFSKNVKQLSIYCTSTATVKNIMICTAADHDASSAYVLYAPTNRELYELILALQNGGNS